MNAPGGRRGGDLAARWAQRPPLSVPDAWVWLLIAVGGYLAGQVVAGVLVQIAAAVEGHTQDLARLQNGPVPPAWLVVSGLVGVWIGFGAAAVLATRLRGTGSLVRDLGLRFAPSDVPVGAAVGAVSQLLLLPLLYLPLRPFVRGLDTKLSQPAHKLTAGFPGADLVLIAVLTAVVVPFVEELLFRGVLLQGLLRQFERLGSGFGPGAACLVTGVLFGAAHAEGLQLLGLAVFGVVLSVLVYRTGRLGGAIVAHATFNLIAVVDVARVVAHW